jgi:hypothetical protein
LLTRRFLIRNTLLSSAGASLASLARGLGQDKEPVSLIVQAGAPLSLVPGNFIGLGYEMSSAAQLGLLSARNTKYVQLVRNLGGEGVLRLGGIVSDYTRYLAQAPISAEPRNTVITHASLVQLRGFLDAVGWTAIWSVNFARNTIDDAITEVREVHRILGPKLEAIELGNEVENYGGGSSPFRRAPYDYPQYLAEYRDWHRKICAAVPGLRFAAPDTAGSVEWVEQMAKDAPGEVQLLTTHYYRAGQRQGTLDQLMRPDPALGEKLTRLGLASRVSGIPWRMCETNSFSGGGRPGLSDTFAAALWTLNYLLQLAQSGCAGVNLETGMNQLGFMSFYSPIKAVANGDVEVGASYYGMLAFAAAVAGGAEMLPAKLETRDSDIVAYAIGKHARPQAAVIINWSETHERSVSLTALGFRSPMVLLLAAPSLNSKDGVTFGQAQIDAFGRWKPAATERIDRSQIVIPPATAVLLKL